MELQRAMRAGITASAVAHLSVLMLVIFFTEVHPFGSLTAEPITVDLVAPEEAAEKRPQPPQPTPTPEPDFSLLAKPTLQASPQPAAAPQPAPAAPSASAPPAAARSQKQAALSEPRPSQQQAVAQPERPSTPPMPAYVPPEPDLSIKYHVMLGLPPDLPPATSEGRSDDAFDAPASAKADISSHVVAEFRRHLRTCSKLPESIVSSDKIKITLRVFMTPEGKLATEPMLIEASASAKGPALMQSAIGALQQCQPFAMLPADRYGEWKTLDLTFTPQDFAGG
jgi:hypothetical protein